MKKIFLFILITFGSVYSQTEYILKDILVEAKLDEDAVAAKKNTPYSKQVYTLKDLRGFGHQTAGDVIKRLPGLYMQGPLNVQRNVKMAGLDKEFQCILINGNRPFGGADRRDLKLDRIPVNMIEKIEVIKNPPSSYTSDAVSGIINIILKEAPQRYLFNFDANGGINTNAEKFNKRIALNYGNSYGDFSFLAALSLHDYVREVNSEFSKFSANGTEDESLDVTMSSLSFDLNYKLGETGNISFQPYITGYDEFTKIDEVNSVNNLIYEEDDSIEDKLRLLQSYGLTYTDKLNSRIEIKTYAGVTINREDKYKDRLTTTLNETRFKEEDEEQRVKEYVTSADLNMAYNVLNIMQNLKLGIKYSFNDRSVNRMVSQIYNGSDNKTVSDESYEIDETIYSGYIQSDMQLSSEFSLIGGFRFEQTSDKIRTDDLTGDKIYSALNPFLNISYKIFENDLFVKGIFSRQISRPPFQYIAPVVKRKNNKTEEGNPDLLPARSFNYNLNFEKYFGKRSYIILGGYYKSISDVIEQGYVGDDPLNNDNPIFRAINISSADIYGVDLESKMSLDILLNYLSCSVSASYMGSEVIDPRTNISRRLKNQPEYIVNFSLVYSNPLNGLDITAGINHIGSRIDPESSAGDLLQEPFTQLDLQIRYYLDDQINLYFNGLNIFNEKAKYSQGGESRLENFGATFKVGAGISL